MAGGIEEGQHLTVLRFHLIGADMLGDAPGFASRHLGVADRIQQRRLAVVHMAHHGDDRRAGLQIFRLVGFGLDHVLDIRIGNPHHPVAELLDDQLGRIGVDRLVLGDHEPHVHQRLDHIGHALGHPVGKLLHDDGLGHLHVAHDLLALLRAAHRLLAGALLLALHRRQRALSPVAARKRLVQGQLARAPALVASPLALALFTLALGLARGRGGLGGRARRSRLRRNLGRRCRGPLCAGFGLSLPARLFLGLLAGALLALAFFAFLRLGLGAAAFALFLAAALFGLARSGFLGLARLGNLQRPQPALHLGLGQTGRAFLLLARRRRRRRGGLGSRSRTGLGHDHALAFRLNNDVLRPAVAEALLHLTRSRAATQAERFFAVTIAHSVFYPFRWPGHRRFSASPKAALLPLQHGCRVHQTQARHVSHFPARMPNPIRQR